MQREVNRSFPRIASRRLHRVVTLLAQAGRTLDAASRQAPDKHERDRLFFFANELREVSIPLSRLARVEKSGMSTAIP